MSPVGLPTDEVVREDWLAGSPMDPTATPAEPLPTLAGFPFAHPGAGIVIVGPTGGGRSSLVQACLYDGAGAGLRGAYLGSEVTEPEFNARAAVLAEHRGDTVNDELRVCLARARYLSLASVVTQAWENPGGWVDGIAAAYDLIVIDPLSAVASALDLNFDQSNAEFVKFYDRLVQPLTTLAGADVAMRRTSVMRSKPRAARRASALSPTVPTSPSAARSSRARPDSSSEPTRSGRSELRSSAATSGSLIARLRRSSVVSPPPATGPRRSVRQRSWSAYRCWSRASRTSARRTFGPKFRAAIRGSIRRCGSSSTRPISTMSMGTVTGR